MMSSATFPAEPLSPFERLFWDMQDFEPAMFAYNEVFAYRIVDFALDRFEAALRAVVEEQPTLRTAFIPNSDGLPTRIVRDAGRCAPIDVDVRDLSDAGDPMARCREAFRVFARTRFELGEPPLFKAFAWRIDERAVVAGVLYFHIIADLWTERLFAEAILRHYAHGATGSKAPTMALAPPIWTSADESYWRTRLTHWPAPISIETGPRRPLKDFVGRMLVLENCELSYAEIRKAQRSMAVSPASVFLAAYVLALASASAAEGLAVGVPCLLRTKPELIEAWGAFLNTVGVDIVIAGRPSYRDVCLEVHRRLTAAITHAAYPQEHMASLTPNAPALNRATLFDHMFTHYAERDLRESDDGEDVLPAPVALFTGTSKFDTSLFVIVRGERMEFRLEYATSFVRETTARALLDRFEQSLRDIVREPDSSTRTTIAAPA